MTQRITTAGQIVFEEASEMPAHVWKLALLADAAETALAALQLIQGAELSRAADDLSEKQVAAVLNEAERKLREALA